MELNGIEYSTIYDISQLIYLAKREKANIGISEYIENHAEMFTLWGLKTRYVLNYKLEKTKIEKSLFEVNKYLDNLQKDENQLKIRF